MTPTDETLLIVGAGVSGCALAAQLRCLGWRGPIRMLEAGRGLGGRAASRPDRQDPGWRLDHGAPFLNLRGAEPPALLQPLLQAGRLRSWPPPATGNSDGNSDGNNDGSGDESGDGIPALRQLEADGRLSEEPGALASEGRLYRGWPAMGDLAAGMLELAEQACRPGGPAAGAPAVERLHGRRVERVDRRDGLWRLGTADGTPLAQGHWLVLSGTLLAHPRCRELLGCDQVPLEVVNKQLQDPGLTRALRAIAGLRYDPRLALLLRLEADQARAWRALPFRHLWLSAAARRRWGLERIVLQPLADGRCGVVAHARPADLVDCGRLGSDEIQGGTRITATTSNGSGTASQAAANADAAAGVGGNQLGDEAERQITALSDALLEALAPWLTAADLPPLGGRQRMLWGGAFPQPPGLDPESMVVTACRLALCGDFLAGEGFGRIEGAWRSGEWLAQRLLPLLSGSRG